MKRLRGSPRVAVVGATGAVGRVMLELLAERKFPAAEVRAFATERSRGRRVQFGEQALVVETLDDRGFAGIELALMDTPDGVSRELVPMAIEAGAVVVDNSGAWRLEDHVPLVVPEINPEALERHDGIVASPNCTTIAVVLPLFALHKRFGIERVVVASYQSVSGAGQAGVEELREQVTKVGEEIERPGWDEIMGRISEPRVFPGPIVFNVIPQIGSLGDEGYTGEEWKLMAESRKIMGLPDLDLTATCVRVPTLVGHGAAVHARFAEELSAESALIALQDAEGVEVVDLPTPLLSAGRDRCYVGRVRRDQNDRHALWFFAACDNLRKGAALNAVQIAERLLS